MEQNNITGRIKKIKFADGTEYPIQDSNAVSEIEVTKTTGKTDDSQQYPYEQITSNFKNGTSSSVAQIKATQTTEGSRKKITLDFQGEKIEFYVNNYDAIVLNPPFLYRLTQEKDEAISIQQRDYIAVRELPYTKSFTLSLNERFFHIAMPKAYSITKIITSNQEPLYLDDDVNFSKQETIFWIDDKPVQTNIYSFHPVIRPESINITFTININ